MLDSLVGRLAEVLWFNASGFVSARARGHVDRVEHGVDVDRVTVVLRAGSTGPDVASVTASGTQAANVSLNAAGRVVLDVDGGSVRLEALGTDAQP